MATTAMTTQSAVDTITSATSRKLRSLPRGYNPPALGGVVQLVRTPACHAGGRGFESRRSRPLYKPDSRVSVRLGTVPNLTCQDLSDSRGVEDASERPGESSGDFSAVKQAPDLRVLRL